MRPRIGLALSGGGFRATCFGLGCLRALHDKDLLRDLAVVSGISGGSLLAALYAYGPSEFEAFDRMTVEMLSEGLQLEIARRALSPRTAIQNLTDAARVATTHSSSRPRLRGATRTDALRATLESRGFDGRFMPDVTHPQLATVLTATDLRTSNAVRFGSLRSSCSAYGVIDEPVSVADAVTASGAFPFLLPTVERRYTFRTTSGDGLEHDVLLTDGGVYDNLGLSVLEPNRSAAHTSHVYDVDYVIACDAGRGALALSWSRFLASRLKRSADVTFRRAQDASRGRLHEAADAGHISGFVHAYLGMRDERLPVPVSDLVAADDVRNYPTNFRAMSPEKLRAISTRGEQLTRLLLSHYCPHL